MQSSARRPGGRLQRIRNIDPGPVVTFSSSQRATALGLLDEVEVAEALRVEAGQGTGHVSLEGVLALWPGLRVHLRHLDNSGYLLDYGRDGDILVRVEDPIARRRFTIAHELGHWLLNDVGLTSRHETGGRIQHEDVVEQWCDRFASALLLPASDVPVTDHVDDVLDWLDAAPDLYGMSEYATLRRYADVTGHAVWWMRGSDRVTVRGFGPAELSAANYQALKQAHCGLSATHSGLRRTVLVDNLVVRRRRGLSQSFAVRVLQDRAQRDATDVIEGDDSVKVN